MAEELKLGNIVQIKTKSLHSPEMVVNGINTSYGTVNCIWYSASIAAYKEQSFAQEALIKIRD